MRAIRGQPSPAHVSLIRAVSSSERVQRFTTTPKGVPSMRQSSAARRRSDRADREGSVTRRAKLAPVTDDVTGQPIPGGPSVIKSGAPDSSASRLASFLRRATMSPVFSPPG